MRFQQFVFVVVLLLLGQELHQGFLIKIAGRPQQVRHHTAINKGCQNITELVENIANALEPVEQEKDQDA